VTHLYIQAFDNENAWFKVNSTIREKGIPFRVGYGSEITLTKKISATIVISHPEVRPLWNDKAPTDYKYVGAYWDRYLWFNAREPDEHYTYGSRLNEPINQIEEAINRLATQPMDRQVTLVIRRPEDISKTSPLIDGHQVLDEHGHPVKWDPPCWTLLDLDIEPLDEGHFKINVIVYFRSWDAFAGFPSNVAGIQLFMEKFVQELNKRSQYTFTTGEMTCISKNIHIYWERVGRLVEEIFGSKKDPRSDWTKMIGDQIHKEAVTNGQ
jgi:thymidylate synthase